MAKEARVAQIIGQQALKKAVGKESFKAFLNEHQGEPNSGDYYRTVYSQVYMNLGEGKTWQDIRHEMSGHFDSVPGMQEALWQTHKDQQLRAILPPEVNNAEFRGRVAYIEGSQEGPDYYRLYDKDGNLLMSVANENVNGIGHDDPISVGLELWAEWKLTGAVGRLASPVMRRAFNIPVQATFQQKRNFLKTLRTGFGRAAGGAHRPYLGSPEGAAFRKALSRVLWQRRGSLSQQQLVNIRDRINHAAGRLAPNFGSNPNRELWESSVRRILEENGIPWR